MAETPQSEPKQEPSKSWLDQAVEAHDQVTKSSWYQWMGWSVAVLGLVVLVYVFFIYYSSQYKTQDSVDEQMVATTTSQADQKHVYKEVYKSTSNAFLCYVRVGTESNCKLFAQNILTKSISDLNITIDYGAFEGSFLPSPDGKVIVIVLEKKGIALDPETVEQKIIIEAPPDRTFGIYTAFPSFVPKAVWVDNTHIKFSLYPDGTMEDFYKDDTGEWVSGQTPDPIDTKIVEIPS